MKPIPKFLNKPKSFWASVRSLSQKVGYSKKGTIIIPTIAQMVAAFENLGLDSQSLVREDQPTQLAIDLLDYFTERSRVLMDEVEPRLLNAEQAKELYEQTRAEFDHKCPIPMNKQKGEKRAEAFLTAIVNMMVERHIGELPCDYDPRELTTITHGGVPLRTLARRLDGAFPSTINPVAVWEIKEYYYTTTFGSRVSGGVYETLLDGMEVEELSEHEGIDVKHYLIADAHFTWWECGKSYLCRMFDSLHMGYADEILFGREVVEEMPRIVAEWVEIYDQRSRIINS
ncbi:hypothetical protein [uncultured Sulfitobacter sp.]|uniref:DUF7687 domain-containing protein n=1 Tax=uncultured Sulfitobacter sp. TaxID=191468 RepID=UPI00262C5DFE|nr:hypothetical protein [uncultured Sulfitobacter sp.]